MSDDEQRRYQEESELLWIQSQNKDRERREREEAEERAAREKDIRENGHKGFWSYFFGSIAVASVGLAGSDADKSGTTLSSPDDHPTLKRSWVEMTAERTGRQR